MNREDGARRGWICLDAVFPTLLSAPAIAAGSPKRPILEHTSIESGEGVTLRVQQPAQPRQKLLLPDALWEGDAQLGQVIHLRWPVSSKMIAPKSR